MSLLEVRGATLRFGGIAALDRVSFSVERGEVFAIVGPNGAGKSTLFNLISRFHDPAEGDIRFEGRSILDRPASEIAGLGIARTFQNIELFEHSTVLQNLLVGRNVHRRASIVAQLLFTGAVRREEIAHRGAVERTIDFLDLQPHREKTIAGLPYGVRKVVEIGRALAMEPRLILLDEPASGLSHEEVVSMRFWIEDIRSRLGVTVLMDAPRSDSGRAATSGSSIWAGGSGAFAKSGAGNGGRPGDRPSTMVFGAPAQLDGLARPFRFNDHRLSAALGHPNGLRAQHNGGDIQGGDSGFVSNIGVGPGCREAAGDRIRARENGVVQGSLSVGFLRVRVGPGRGQGRDVCDVAAGGSVVQGLRAGGRNEKQDARRSSSALESRLESGFGPCRQLGNRRCCSVFRPCSCCDSRNAGSAVRRSTSRPATPGVQGPARLPGGPGSAGWPERRYAAGPNGPPRTRARRGRRVLAWRACATRLVMRGRASSGVIALARSRLRKRRTLSSGKVASTSVSSPAGAVL